jgi:hypothetical protein
MKIGNFSLWVSCMLGATVLDGFVVSAGDVYITGGTTTVIQQQQAEPVVTSVDDFREPLSKYGTWMEIEDYGTVWQPQVVIEDVSWRPYCHGGQWIWSDRGWLWQSTYAWGWAPFHYGRWVHARHYGWLWVPDVIWAPAWVEWRSSETYVGWAPKCPEPRNGISFGFSLHGSGVSFGFEFSDEDRYCFVPHHRVSEVQVVPYLVPREEMRDIYGHSAPTLYGRHDERRRDDHGVTQRTEMPRNVSIQSGRRTEQLQERFRSVSSSPVSSSRSQIQSSRAQAIQELMARSNGSGSSRSEKESPNRIFPNTRKPLRQIMEERHITSDRLSAAVAKIRSPETRSRVSDEIRRRLAENR